ncbi:DUF1611 domain-containing protein [Sphingomonas hengshuiensis]|uniref:EBNA-1 nuclear protein n=1 Tax=Sphingomonas hengshuiensis TaxID=1609977 RepID=A0A7U4LE81_9SPHN|nr:DUF1611 domain-containing protein [Sphingomonas hengshuiensis]AJP71199.1 EBNA-1 nuclear protein [Sphingomonas hengshuiensis]
MQSPYLIFLGDANLTGMDKMGAGIRQWRGELCLAQHRLPGCAFDLDLPEMAPAQAQAAGCRTMIVGVVNVGGFIPENWIATIVDALESGLDVAAGMHTRLIDIPAIAEAAARTGRSVHDVRAPTRSFAPGTGRKRSGKRVLTMGTDCAVGKKYTALAIERELRARGVDADFRATGQTGLLIAGRGVVIDAVIADFVSGAAEWLSPDADPAHWDVIEGQGSLAHPAYAAVTLGLAHGSQPDAIVLCHEPGRAKMLGLDYPVPTVSALAEMALQATRLTNPAAQVVGVSINGSNLDRGSIDAVIAGIEAETGLPCCDPLLHGPGRIVDRLLG